MALCVANTYGPDDYQPTPHNGNLWHTASGKLKVAVDVSQPTVDIRDVAEAALLAEAHGHAGERYIIANEFVSNRDFFAMAAAQTGQKPPKFMPYKLAYGIAWIAERVAKLAGRKDMILTTDAVYLSNVFREMDNSKARRELGWTPRPLAETVHDAIAWFGARESLSALNEHPALECLYLRRTNAQFLVEIGFNRAIIGFHLGKGSIKIRTFNANKRLYHLGRERSELW